MCLECANIAFGYIAATDIGRDKLLVHFLDVLHSRLVLCTGLNV